MIVSMVLLIEAYFTAITIMAIIGEPLGLPSGVTGPIIMIGTATGLFLTALLFDKEDHCGCPDCNPATFAFVINLLFLPILGVIIWIGAITGMGA